MDPELAELSRTVAPALLGGRIRAARLAAGLTQSELAGEDASTAYVCRIEDGQRRPSVRLLPRLARRLDTSVDSLVRGCDLQHRDAWRLALDHAELALVTGDARSALDETERVLSEVRDAGVEDLVADAEHLRAGALEGLGDLDGAITVLEDLTSRPEPSVRWIRALIALARCHDEQGDFARAIEVGESAMPAVRELGLSGLTEAIQLSVTVAGSYLERGDVDHALRMCRRATEEAERVGSPVARASAYWNASVVAARKGDATEALRTARRALTTFEEGEDARNVGRLRTLVADLQLQVDPPDPAEAKAQLARAEEELAWAATSPADKAERELVLARAHHMLGEPAEAAARLDSCRRLAGDGAPLLTASALVLAGRMAAAAGRAEDARDDYRRAALVLTGVGADRETAQLWFELGGLLLELDDRDAALDAFRRAGASSGLRHRTPRSEPARPAGSPSR